MIVLKNITKIYNEGSNPLTALDNVSLHVQQGDFLSIMGRSGCGKTTLLNIIGCIDTFTHGQYRFLDTEIAKQTRAELAEIRRNRIGYVFQAFNLVEELTCEENVALTLGYAGKRKNERHERAMELLEMVNLADKAKNYPSQLSGGQKQRIAIARAVSNNPLLILADEPTGNLDYANGVDIMKLLQELNKKGTAIIMVTHDDEFAKYANRILQMQDGVFID